MKAIRVHEPGGPEALRYEDIPRPEPGPGEALVKVEAAGLNFIDVYHRKGLYPLEPPFTPGVEGAGRVVALGEDVQGLEPGARVAWVGGRDAYAEYASVAAERLVPLPEDVEVRTAAAVMLQGMTAHYLACSTVPLGPEDTCLVHAAAGGVGLLLCQIAAMRGTRVLGTASTEEKAARARAAGADEVILYTRENFRKAVERLTDGRGVQVVYDSVGQATFLEGLRCLAPRGTMVLFGQSSGPVDPFDPQLLNRHGSLYLTRPSLFHYVAAREELLARAGDLFEWLRAGRLSVRIDRELPVERAEEAHRALEGRETSGKVLLLPDS